MPFIEARRAWERRLSIRAAVIDAVVVLLAVLSSHILLRSTIDESTVQVPGPGELRVGYEFVSIVLVLSWWTALTLARTRRPRILGDLPKQLGRVLASTFAVFGVFAIVSYLLKLEIGRGYLLTAVPIGLLLLGVTRLLLWVHLRSERRSGSAVYRTVLVGQRDNATHVAKRMGSGTWAAHELVGVVVPGLVDDPCILGIPVLTGHASIIEAAAAAHADTVTICGSDELTPGRLRQLGWELGDRGIRLVVAPTLTDVSGSRLHLEAVAGLPLLHVSFRELRGARAVTKRLVDVFGSAALLLVAAPMMAAVAVGITLTSPGPVFYRQERIGRDGRPFGMLKFRSMVPDADGRLAELLAAQGNADRPLFKVENDPRITPIGRFIRKYSLDEFPQLLNVLGGSMSLVGPRPQREAEVALYDDSAHRRLLVKPGMSGLWQVSGRSSLSWDESIDLDLDYVENLSAARDFLILVKTFRAVVAPGADAH